MDLNPSGATPLEGDRLQGKARPARGFTAGLVLAFGAAVAVGALIAPHFSYNRWDNFVYYTPTILDAHVRWLHGHFPLWTSHQNLGEPLLANGLPGVFYPVYTAAVAVVELLGRPGWLMGIVAAVHFTLGLAGWLLLFELLGLRRWLAAVAAFSVEGGGFVALIVPLWTFMGGVLCWMPWILYGSLRALRDPEDPRGLWVPVGLLLLAVIGHPQMVAYAWLWLLITAGLFGWVERAPIRAWARWSMLLASGALLSGLVLVPVYLESHLSTRQGILSFAEYAARSVAPSDLLSVIVPVVRSIHAYHLTTVGSLSFYQGSWIALALGAGVLAVGAGASRGRKLRRARQGASPELLFLCAAGGGLLFVLLALGRWGGLIPLAYGIPVWSSFRWPFKFLLFAGASISLAAGLGAEAWLRRLSEGDAGSALRLGLALWAAVLVAVADTAGWIGRHPGYFWAFWALFVLSALALVGADRRWGATLLAVCAWGGVALVQGFAQLSDIERYDEPVAAYGPSVLGIDASARVLPVSFGPPPTGMQAMALYHSGSLNGYDVATGNTPMVPTWLHAALPSDGLGLLPDSTYERLLGSRLLKALDIRYAIAPNDDREAAARLELHGFRPIRRLTESSVYEQDGVLPRVYFAREARPYSPRAVRRGLIDDRAPLRTAFLEGISERAVLPDARVDAIDPRPNGIRAEVDAPDGGFAVFSSTFYPQWRAFADGKRIPVVRVNGLVTGARIPPGTRTLEFRFGFAGFGLTLLSCAFGLSTLALWLWTRRRASPTGDALG